MYDEKGDEEVITIGTVAFLKTMWALFWTAFIHPCTNTVVDLTTGDIIPQPQKSDGEN